MQIKKSVVSGQSADLANEQAISIHSTDVNLDPQRNIQMVQNVLLIWLDQNIEENNADCQNTIKQLRHVVNNINKFTDIDTCIQFLERINEEKACIIVSGSFAQHIVPKIHPMSQVDSIFIFCSDKEYHQQWIVTWSKIKGAFTEITLVCEALKNAAKECEHNTVSISIMATDDEAQKNLDQLDPYFMYLQIMKEILLNIDFEPKHFGQYIDYCREVFAENDRELRNTNKLERQYPDKTPIWWYTLESFLYPMVNRGLRSMDVNIIIKMGFFIKDLHNHIKQLHQEQFHDVHSPDKFIVYRGQGMPNTEFEHLSKTKGGLISFNNFLSTSKKRSVSLGFANRALANPDLIGVLFIITIDPSQSTTPFASIKDVSAIQSEDEVLFAMQTVFRIDDITSMDRNTRLYQVELSLTNDNDKDLRQLTDYIRKEAYPKAEGWYRLGLVLYKMGQFKKSEEVYQILLEQTMNDNEKADIYVHLGKVKGNQGEYEETITLNEKAIEIYKKNLPLQNVNLAAAYNNIGIVYKDISEYSKALSYHEKSLEILQQALSPNHPGLAMSYINIGNVYDDMGEYSKALSYYENSLTIQQQSLPPNHPDVASSYKNIGSVYATMGEYLKALSYYEKSLQIRQQSLPPNHPDLASSYNSIGIMYKNMGEYSEALSCYEKSLEIQQQSLSPNHRDLAMSYSNIGIVYDNMGEYSTALSYYEKSLEIDQKSLPPNHPDVASDYNNIGSVYYNMNEYSKALLYYEKSLEIKQQSLPSYHPNLASSYNNVGAVFDSMGEYSRALSCYEKSLDIDQKSLPPNHPDLVSDYNNIGLAYKKMGDYSKALSYYEKSLEIKQRSLPSNHPSLASSYCNIGLLYENMGNYSKAHSSLEQALQIVQQSLPETHPVFKQLQNNFEGIKQKL